MPKDSGIGASTKRVEDQRFLTGKGRYTSDINLVNQTHAVFLRSDVAHGAIKSIDTAAAAAMPGVLAIFTGEDFAEVGGNPAGWAITSRDGEPMKEPKRPVLAHGKVRHVGDAYAAVVAETYQQAKDAAQQLADDTVIEELPAIMTSARQRDGALERASVDFVETIALRCRVGEIFDGMVLSHSRNGAKVQLHDPAVLAPIREQPEVGETVRLHLDSIDSKKRRVVFSVVH